MVGPIGAVPNARFARPQIRMTATQGTEGGAASIVPKKIHK